MTNTLLAQAKAAAAKLADQSDVSGGFEYEVPPAGRTPMRFVSYIEIGTFPQNFNGQAKKPAPECILEFQLLGKKHRSEYEVEVDGEKVTKVRYNTIRIGRGPSGKGGMSMPGGDRSNHYKLLKAMDYGRGNTHMAFMLGEAFIGEVVHVERGEGKDKVTFANLKDANGWKISAPRGVNAEGEEVDINVPEATVPLRMLLQDAPTKEQWDSIFIDGTYTKKDGDKEVEVSRNWIQATCQQAMDWDGSAIQAVIATAEGDLPDIPADDVLDTGDTGGAERDEAPSPDEGTSEDKTPTSEAPSEDEDDPLAGLDIG